MKSFLRLAPVLGMMIAGSVITGCSNGEERLAKAVPGVWQGTPETFTDNSALTASIIDVYEFSPASMTANETLTGSVTVSGMVNTTTQIVDSAFIEPLSLSASAHTSISGTWTVVDDDEISLSFDLASLMVQVDPKAVMANNAPITIGSPAVDSLRPEVCANIEHSIKQSLTARYASMRHMDDVKVKGPLLKYEVGHEDFVLTKQMN